MHFEYEAVVLHTIEPRTGPVRGGTAVTLFGGRIHAPGAEGLFCKFAGAPAVGATRDGEETVRCSTPPSLAAGRVAVRLINNDAVYAATVAFEYLPVASVSSIEPPVGLLAGSTQLRVRGSGFLPSASAFCRVGAHRVVVAPVVSGSLLECQTPSHTQPELLGVEVSSTGSTTATTACCSSTRPPRRWRRWPRRRAPRRAARW